MKKLAVAIVFVFVFFASSARAAHPEAFDLMKKGFRSTPSASDSGSFDPLGMPGRSWEIRSDTAFGTNRVLAQRIEVATAIALARRVHVVVRANLGIDADTRSGLYSPQGPLPSLGVRMISDTANFWFEGGLRALIPYPGPNDHDPGTIGLAREAVVTSTVADDAQWLPFSSFGAQAYLVVHSRFCAAPHDHDKCSLFLGAQYGLTSSLGDAYVTSWLGPQHGYIGNGFAELFATIPNLGWRGNGVQIGFHADVSLSTIWPGNEPFPAALVGFVGWEPLQWFAARMFLGTGGPIKELGHMMPYGLQLTFYVP